LFAKLVQRGYATACGCLHNRAEVYHVRRHALYRAIGVPHSHYRRPVSARQVIERLMRLDSIAMFPDLMYLATEDEKVALFGAMASSLPRERLPHLTVGKGASQRVRLFPEDQPIAVTSTGRVVFTYVVAAGYVEEFRAFVQRHADLLGALPAWTLRVLFPRPVADAMRDFEAAARYELTTPLRPDTLAALKRYFNQCQATSNPRALSFSDEEFWRDQSAFSAPRFRQLYRRWLTDGDAVFDAVSSPALGEVLESGTGRIESHVLPFSYRQLSPLASLVRSAARGVEEGDIATAPPRPPPPSSLSISDQSTRDWDRSIGRT
jgi:hypothetical protein